MQTSAEAEATRCSTAATVTETLKPRHFSPFAVRSGNWRVYAKTLIAHVQRQCYSRASVLWALHRVVLNDMRAARAEWMGKWVRSHLRDDMLWFVICHNWIQKLRDIVQAAASRLCMFRMYCTLRLALIWSQWNFYCTLCNLSSNRWMLYRPIAKPRLLIIYVNIRAYNSNAWVHYVFMCVDFIRIS